MHVKEPVKNDNNLEITAPVFRHRKMQTMTAVIDINIPGFIKYSRLPWVFPTKNLPKFLGNVDENRDPVGIYLFGGLDLDNNAIGDLYLLKPDYKENDT